MSEGGQSHVQEVEIMRVGYYPGCSLGATASDYTRSIEAVAQLLDVQLIEVEDWNCCGASAAHGLDHALSINLSARNLNLAERLGLDVVVPCSLCFNRLKTAEKALLSGSRSEYPFSGNIQVLDLSEFMAEPQLLGAFVEKVVNPLKGLKAVCYYGCLSSRPPKVTGQTDFENPMSLDRMVKACGAEALDWPYKADCCGASHAVPRLDLVDHLVGRLCDMALAVGAQCLVVRCQMCQANVDMYQDRVNRQQGKEYNLPVLYFTELMALASGLPCVAGCLKRHFVDAVPLLKRLDLM